ncbi:Mov34/MPN/PAD-1 family protein [Microvirga arabica]|uniref:Mov34/MPN/PAD-1 family protein n=1 Tax=Microvirga arabica TaxID=1128671 RepID=A0ABV6YE41_9HYPH
MPAVLQHFAQHKQIRWYQKEAGGQLFAEFDGHDVVVTKATGPRWSDKRTRHTYEPNRRAEQREIERLHKAGLHFVGDWHTHAEPVPEPSTVDRTSMQEAFRKSRHALNAFIMVIVGQVEAPGGLYVAVCDQVGVYPLKPSASAQLRPEVGRRPTRRIL